MKVLARKKKKYQAWLHASMSNPVDQILVCLKKWEEASDWSKYFSLPNPSTRIWDVSEDIARIFFVSAHKFPSKFFVWSSFFFRIYIRKIHPPAVLAALSNGTKSGNAQCYLLKSVLLGSQQSVPSSQQLLWRLPTAYCSGISQFLLQQTNHQRNYVPKS